MEILFIIYCFYPELFHRCFSTAFMLLSMVVICVLIGIVQGVAGNSLFCI